MNFVRSFFAPPSPKKDEELTKEDLTNTRKSVLLFVDVDDHTGDLTIKKEVEKLIKDDDALRVYVDSIIKTIPKGDDPKRLSDFHYEYRAGKLVNVTTGKPFHWVNQIHYDVLGDIIVRHVQDLMVKDYGLKEILLPLPKASSNEEGSPSKKPYNGPYNNIFVTPDWDTCEKLMLLIQGSGAVRAGQWARALCINETLDLGTILPYLDKCKTLGYGVIVFNPNLNDDYVSPPSVLRRHMLTTQKVNLKLPEKIKIKGHSNPHKHDLYLWDNFVCNAKAKVIAAVAHSAGGDGACAIVRSREAEVAKRLCGIAFTDSVHGIWRRDEESVKHYIQKKCRNWVRSDLPLDTKIAKPDFDCLQVSAGHEKHEYTSGMAINSVFDFLVKRTQLFLEGESPNDTNYDQMSSSSSSTSEEEEEEKKIVVEPKAGDDVAQQEKGDKAEQ
jgi:hypothetical protein